MAIHKAKGARLFIGPVVDVEQINAASDEAALGIFEAISGGDWEEVEEVEDLGEIGDTSEEITFTAIRSARVRKMKGARNAGTAAIVVGRDPLDDGQQAMIAAEKTDFNYAFKIEYADARTPSYTHSIEYYAGLVLSRPTNIGNVANVVRRTFSVAVNTAIYAVDTAALSAPANLQLPAISGVAQVGETLTALEGVWSNNPTSYQYQWVNDDSGDLVGAINKTYTPQVSDEGDAISVKVTAINAAGNATAESAPSAGVLAA